MARAWQSVRVSRLSKVALGLALLFGLVLALSPLVAAASGPAVLRPDPLSLGLRPGEQGAMTIRGENVQGMYGLEIHLSFDPAIVEVVDTDPDKPGIQVKAGDWLKEGFVALNRADNAAGTIDYAATLLNPAPAVSGAGTVAVVTFKAKANGASPVKMTKAILASREAQEIPSVWQEGAVGVSAQGQAPAVEVTISSTPAAAPAVPAGGAAQVASSSQPLLLAAAGLGALVFAAALVLVLVAARRRSR
jgi:trimeric autotransporter adhesin